MWVGCKAEGVCMKRKWMIGCLGLIFVLIVTSCTTKTPTETQQKTNTTPTLYSLKEQKEVLKRLPEFYSLAFSTTTKEKGSYIVPGLVEAETLAMNQQGKLAVSTSMDPQGVTVTEDYLLISCYSYDPQYHSVIFVLDKHTHHYIKTVVLDGNPHVGGIVYDSVNQNIWIANDVHGGKHARVSAIALSTLERYQLHKEKKPIAYTQTIELPELSRASFIGYKEDALFVGDFSQRHEGRLYKYGIDQKGKINATSIRKIRLLDNTPESIPIPQKIQGVTFYKDTILFSQSFGKQHSKILIYKDTKDDYFFKKDVIKEIEAPPYMEQIYASGSSLYVLFESATQRFRNEFDVEKVDRVLRLDLSMIDEGR